MKWTCDLLILMIVCNGMGDEQNAPSDSESGATFLHTVIDQLHNERQKPSTHGEMMFITDRETEPKSVEEMKIMGPTPIPETATHSSLKSTSWYKETLPPPPPPLSKEELEALYQAAVNKGTTLDLASLFKDTSITQDLQGLQSLVAPAQAGHETLKDTTNANTPGYYYYFYPIKSFNKGEEKNNNKENVAFATNQVPSVNPQFAEMVPTAMMLLEGGTNDRTVEPLFVAMAGFIGMALMFVFSVLFLPKFGTLRSRGITALKNVPDELSALTKLVLEAIDGKDCSERIICELGRAVRKMKLDSKPLRQGIHQTYSLQVKIAVLIGRAFVFQHGDRYYVYVAVKTVNVTIAANRQRFP
uniref:Uncharacterized protein n=1 Tax=Timema monikensis TaxID=170555 RepID=A0A7R9E982_9NEOP|nr:unnamed protein product [Timema monikensis]